MSAELVSAVAAVVASMLSLLSVFYFGAVKLTTIQVKVDTMWNFMMRRATSEAVKSGFGTLNSPFMAKASVIRVVEPILSPMKDFYEADGKSLTDNDLALEVEKRWGDVILKEVCIPNQFSMGACLVLIISALRGRVLPDPDFPELVDIM